MKFYSLVSLKTLLLNGSVSWLWDLWPVQILSESSPLSVPLDWSIPFIVYWSIFSRLFIRLDNTSWKWMDIGAVTLCQVYSRQNCLDWRRYEKEMNVSNFIWKYQAGKLRYLLMNPHCFLQNIHYFDFILIFSSGNISLIYVIFLLKLSVFSLLNSIFLFDLTKPKNSSASLSFIASFLISVRYL